MLFARPRSLAIKHERAFHVIAAEIWGLIEGSVRESLGSTPSAGAEVPSQGSGHDAASA